MINPPWVYHALSQTQTAAWCLDGLTPREVFFNIDPTTDVAFTG